LKRHRKTRTGACADIFQAKHPGEEMSEYHSPQINIVLEGGGDTVKQKSILKNLADTAQNSRVHFAETAVEHDGKYKRRCEKLKHQFRELKHQHTELKHQHNVLQTEHDNTMTEYQRLKQKHNTLQKEYGNLKIIKHAPNQKPILSTHVTHTEHERVVNKIDSHRANAFRRNTVLTNERDHLNTIVNTNISFNVSKNTRQIDIESIRNLISTCNFPMNKQLATSLIKDIAPRVVTIVNNISLLEQVQKCVAELETAYAESKVHILRFCNELLQTQGEHRKAARKTVNMFLAIIGLSSNASLDVPLWSTNWKNLESHGQRIYWAIVNDQLLYTRDKKTFNHNISAMGGQTL